MRLIIIGAVAAGTSAAAKARRNNEEAEIVIYEMDSYISYSGCGMPYYLGKEIGSEEELTPRDSEFFRLKYNVEIQTLHEVLSINPTLKSLEVKNLTTGEIFTDHYDKLVLATGASAVKPPIQGAEGEQVFTLRNINDMHQIKSFLDQRLPKSAAIIGTGFIGLEMCENLKKLGMAITLIEKLPQVTPGLDADMAVYIKEHLEEKQVPVHLNATVKKITEHTVELEEGIVIEADLVLLATGVRPNIHLAKQAGIKIGITGAIEVDHTMRTSDSDIYACGDCVQQTHLITGKPVHRPLGSTANKTGRIAGDCVTGGDLSFRGILGTGIFKVFDLTVAQTGLSSSEARENGFEIVVCHNIKPNKPEYLGGKEMIIKGIADKKCGRLLGVQIVGPEGVDKRIDVFATAITFGAKAEDLFHLDLAYAPPFSTTKDPVMYTGMILENAIHRGRELIPAQDVESLIHSGEKYVMIDARDSLQFEKGHLESAQSIPHSRLRESLTSLDPEVPVITYCNKGVTGNAVQNILINHGFRKVYNISGGYKQFRIQNKHKKEKME